LGGEAAFRELMAEVKALGLGWLQDIVPNHASYSPENTAVYDLWASGAGSKSAASFDVNWAHPLKRLNGKILLPFLAQPLQRCLTQGQISLAYNGGFKIKYSSLELPVNSETSMELSRLGCLEEVLTRFNHNPQQLHKLLSKQYYTLSYWKTAQKHINYRRFFDIVDLIGVRIEDPATFAERHRLIFELAREGCFSGLRVDHIDGLYEPQVYLNKLRQELPEAYLLVEKILTDTEQLPQSWQIQGATGYEFLNYTNNLFIQTGSEPAVDAFYKQFTGNTRTFSDLLYDSKKRVIETSFLGDIQNLSYLCHSALLGLQCTTPDVARFSEALAELFACFPVYRTYLGGQQSDSNPFRMALRIAIRRNPGLEEEFSAIQFLLEQSQTVLEALHALMRLQQFTGAVTAKGFEDTALYRYVRLISLNDVGGNPTTFGITPGEFHDFNLQRQKRWPHTLNALSTHDTKRGEDVRARLNVLSEIPAEFKTYVAKWAELAAPRKRRANGETAPDPNEEYFLYQTLLGAYPWETSEQQQFKERIKQYLVKALREAKTHTSWLSPNAPYEDAVAAFAAELLDDNGFLEAFLPLEKKIAYLGFYNTLAQTLLKITCPGVPDFYQGTELWDLNLVDPDNRRPVDFQKRQTLLAEVAKLKPEKAPELLAAYSDAKAKLYAIHKAMLFRRKHRRLFEEGEYLPLAVGGTCSDHVVAFARKKGGSYAVTIVPRFLASLLYIRGGGSWQSSFVSSEAEAVWADTYVSLPEADKVKWVDAFTDRTFLSRGGRLLLRDVFDGFPVVLLWGNSGG
jgi:(1->4)-alpha-D-glucan 1-alpha-D-glucosylmutase